MRAIAPVLQRRRCGRAGGHRSGSPGAVDTGRAGTGRDEETRHLPIGHRWTAWSHAHGSLLDSVLGPTGCRSLFLSGPSLAPDILNEHHHDPHSERRASAPFVAKKVLKGVMRENGDKERSESGIGAAVKEGLPPRKSAEPRHASHATQPLVRLLARGWLSALAYVVRQPSTSPRWTLSN